MTDRQIQENVQRELDGNTRAKAENIAVTVTDGVVTLFGFVDSPAQRQLAVDTATRVYGVRGVANELEVISPTAAGRPDPELAREAVWALDVHNNVVPTRRIQVTVRDGWIILVGEVDWNYQREAAEAALAHLRGVKGIRNRITVQPHVARAEVQSERDTVLRRSAERDVRRIQVEVTDTAVVLSGSVNPSAGRERAEQATRRAAGVEGVENRIRATYWPTPVKDEDQYDEEKYG